MLLINSATYPPLPRWVTNDNFIGRLQYARFLPKYLPLHRIERMSAEVTIMVEVPFVRGLHGDETVGRFENGFVDLVKGQQRLG